MHTFVIFALNWNEGCMNMHRMCGLLFSGCIQYADVIVEITLLLSTCVFLLSIHLTCWLDLEQYRRTPQKEKAVRHERSSHIATKYLDRKYFFGSDSPATSEQQNDVCHMDSKHVQCCFPAFPSWHSDSAVKIEYLSTFRESIRQTGTKKTLKWDVSLTWHITFRFDKQRLQLSYSFLAPFFGILQTSCRQLWQQGVGGKRGMRGHG